jgi:hypothetical protein
MSRLGVVLALPLGILLVSPPSTLAWSGGPVYNVTDLDPKCAVCHASVTKDQLRTEPAGVANYLFVENLHYKAIEDGKGPYQSMAPADRQKLLADVKAVDQGASVTMSVPTTLQPGQEVQITVSAQGGNEVLAVALVDTDLRQKARIIQADGWQIVGPPKVVDSRGAEQTKWVEGRGTLSKNINSAVIWDQKADLAAKKFAGGKATWTVKAPQQPGTYSLTAVLFHGTEKASSAGTVMVGTTVAPRAGSWGNAGRVVFSKPVTVTVR